MNDSSVTALLEDSVIMASGALLRHANYTDTLTVRSTSEYNSHETLPTDRSCDCEQVTESIFFVAFVAMLLLSVALFVILVIIGIIVKTRNSLINSLSNNSPDNGINLEKFPSNEITIPLLGNSEGCDPLVALEHIIGLAALSFRAKKLLHQNLIAEINTQFETKLKEVQQDIQCQETQLVTSKKVEVKNLKIIFNEIKNSTSCNWDKIKQVLEQLRAEKEKLIDEKLKEKIYNLQHHDDAQKLHFKICTVRQNKEFLVDLEKLAMDTLKQWRKVFNNFNEGMNQAPLPSMLFLLLETLLQDRLNHAKNKHENQLQDKGNKYLRDIERVQENFTKKCVDLETCYKENCNTITRDQDTDLTSSPWNDGNLMEKVKELYDIKTQILDVKLSLEMKKTQDEYSEVTLKLRHLENVIQLQNEHFEDMEKILELIMNTQKIYIQVLAQLYKETEIKIDGERKETEKPLLEQTEVV